MNPNHHIPEEWLLAYANGTAPEGLALLIATHASLCPVCRATIAEFEAVGGAMFARPAETAVSADLLDRVLARLDEPGPIEAKPQFTLAADIPALPEPLRSYVGDRNWRFVVPGIRAIELPVQVNGIPVVLARLKPGLSVPPHTHRGVEAHLVLTGGYNDTDGAEFLPGDTQFADDDIHHGLQVHDDGFCVTLIVRQAPVVQHSWRGRLFSWLTGV